jgi:hypothetical protein
MGYKLNTPETIEAGNALCVTLFWHTDRPTNTAYNIFVHLNAPDGYVQAQRDTSGLFGFSPTTNWPANKIVGDMHCLATPLGLAPGTYSITAGVYQPDIGERLHLVKSETPSITPGAPIITPIEIIAP